nr:DUF1643 domain-containing protein [Leucobacter weissii]
MIVPQEAWLYENNGDNSARFVLGTVGENPLVCFGINPSTAVPGALDPTVRRVAGFAAGGGYDSWVMLNVYPQIATDPKGIHRTFDPSLKSANEQSIERLIAGRPLGVLAAWGGLIESRGYLPTLLADIVSITDAAGRTWMSLGELLGSGHPRHPSRARGDLPLQPFDVSSYLSRQGQ